VTQPSTTRYACPVCGTVHEHQSERYKNHVCQECDKRARCAAHDRPVVGRNTHMSGGFEAIHYDRGDNRCDQVTADGKVFIDGTQFRMQEARFGGTVTTPMPGGYIPVEQTVQWSREGHIEWTSAGNPAPFVGYVGEKTKRVGLMRRRVSTWEWMVRKIDPDVTQTHHVVKQGVAATLDQAKARAIEVLDHMNVLLHEQG
jgi:hypothetical protein